MPDLLGPLQLRIYELEQERDDLQTTVALFSQCMQRAKERWEKAHPDTDYWPDGADNIIWLLEELDKLYDRCAELVDADKALEKVREERDKLQSHVEESEIAWE